MNYHHACGVQVDGTAWCWGQNSDEQITGAPGANVPITAPHQIDAATDWVKVTAGDDFTCGIRSTGVAECWGDNAEGQHGDGTQAFWLEPQPVVFGS